MRLSFSKGEVYSVFINKRGGFAFATAEEGKAWLRDPETACSDHPRLLGALHDQTHGRGFAYSDFDVRIKVWW